MGIYNFKKPYILPLGQNTFATFELLRSSLSISISGAARVYLAAILLNSTYNLSICFAAFFIIYSVYLFDRALDSEEDSVNRTELNGSNKNVGFAVSLLAFVIGTYILVKEGILILAFIPFVTGYLYSKGIKIGKFALKLKGGLGIKNIVVGLTWGIFIAGLPVSCGFIPVVMIFILYGVKTFINSVIDDFKDIEGDTLAGIKTLPVSLGTRKTRNLLTVMHLLSHIVIGIAVIHGTLAFEPLIILYSFVCGLICIQKYTDEKKVGLAFFKDGESVMTITLRGLESVV